MSRYYMPSSLSPTLKLSKFTRSPFYKSKICLSYSFSHYICFEKFLVNSFTVRQTPLTAIHLLWKYFQLFFCIQFIVHIFLSSFMSNTSISSISPVNSITSCLHVLNHYVFYLINNSILLNLVPSYKPFFLQLEFCISSSYDFGAMKTQFIY